MSDVRVSAGAVTVSRGKVCRQSVIFGKDILSPPER
jgi:hypothetical protein